MTSSDPIIYEVIQIPETTSSMAFIRLNRPEDLNALNWELVDAFDAAVDKCEHDDHVRVLFITGNGRAFSAGGDLKRYLELQRDAIKFTKFVDSLHRVFGRLRTLRVPTVALVNGVTAAGGLELILNCDVAIAASSARIGDAHLNYGQMGGGGVLTLLARYVGIQKAAELIFTGRLLTSDEAANWGLINRVVPDEELLDEAYELARRIALKSPLAILNAKKVMTKIWAETMTVEQGLRIELEENVTYCTTSFDAQEGLDAFSSKREPRFRGK
jgi:enoyl-CoA hydratase/carnithine racemase